MYCQSMAYFQPFRIWLLLGCEDHEISESKGTKISFNSAPAQCMTNLRPREALCHIHALPRPAPCWNQSWYSHDINTMKSNVLQMTSQGNSEMNSSFILGEEKKQLSKNRGGKVGRAGRQEGAEQVCPAFRPGRFDRLQGAT